MIVGVNDVTGGVQEECKAPVTKCVLGGAMGYLHHPHAFDARRRNPFVDEDFESLWVLDGEV
jgi:hypothetical protein